MIYPINHIQSVIRVGVQTERGVEEIGFDMTPWMTRWPGMTFAVWVTRPGEEASYPAADVEMVGNVLYWYPNGTDTEKEGAGRVEVVGIGEGKCKSTGVMDTLVKATTLDVTQETPETIRPWAEKVMEAAQTVKTAVDAGEGTLYLVRTTASAGVAYYADRPFDEVVKAIEDGKTVLLAHKGKTHVCVGLENGKPTFDTGIERVGFLAHSTFCHIKENGRISISTGSYFKGHTPYELKIEHDGKTETFDGSADVKIKIEGGGVPDPGKAFQQLVSDADGKAVWQEQIAYKHVKSGTMTLFAEETLMNSEGEDEGNRFFSATPLAAMPEVGKQYEVTINGTVYTTTAHPLEDNGAVMGVMLGNAGTVYPDNYEDTGEPYVLMTVLPEYQTMTGGMTMIMLSDLDVMPITLSIRGYATITDIKKIDPDLLPGTRKTITIMIDADGNVMCDTPFETAWAMTPGELQAAIVIRETSNFKGTTYTAADNVSKAEGGFVPSMYGGRVINIRVRKPFLDVSDLGDKDTTRFLTWAEGGLGIATEMSYAMPILPVGQQSYVGRYARYNGSTWNSVTIDQMKKDLGLT